MRGRLKTKGMKSRGGSGGRDRNLVSTGQESTGTTAHTGGAYGMAKGPKQVMAGAAKSAKGGGKIRKGAIPY
jgi:hypothetical protein